MSLNDGQATGSGAIAKGLSYSPLNYLSTTSHCSSSNDTTSQDIKGDVTLDTVCYGCSMFLYSR